MFDNWSTNPMSIVLLLVAAKLVIATLFVLVGNKTEASIVSKLLDATSGAALKSEAEVFAERINVLRAENPDSSEQEEVTVSEGPQAVLAEIPAEARDVPAYMRRNLRVTQVTHASGQQLVAKKLKLLAARQKRRERKAAKHDSQSGEVVPEDSMFDSMTLAPMERL